MKLMKKIAIFLFAQSVLFFSACRTGVDDSVDLKGPTVTIISPEARENVGEKFEIRCIVTDDFAVGLVTVELDGNTWQHKGSAWQYKPKDGNNFVPYDKAEWIAENKKKVEFCIKDATIEGTGTFTIKVTAIDESGNSSEESTKSRDVIIDKDAPEITLSAPYVAQEPETFKSITNYRDITKITQFLTGDFTISGKTSEENGIQSIEVRITEYGGKDENELFTKRIVQDQAYKTSESDIVVDSLRSWEIPVRLAECAPLAKLDEKQHILSISTSACDTAGNESGWTRQGYACMWKEADTPWIDIILGTDASSPKNVYSGSSLLGNAYDDTAIKSIYVTIKRADKSIYGEYDKKQIYSASKDAEDENNVYFELPLPADSGDYSVEITATDNRGNVSNPKTGWIKVVDKLFPSIEITHNSESGKLFFDKDGNFTLKIISKDESKVASLKMAYITALNDDALKEIVAYSNSNSDKWENESTSLNNLVNGKVYSITPNDTGKTIAENGLTRKIYENEVKINIFNDLGIDGNSRELTNKTFVFRIEDGDKNALTSTYAIQGDIEAPKIEFTKLEYYSSKDNKNPVTTRTQEGGEMLPPFGDKTYVKVYGKISDNSTDILKNCKKYLKLELTANDYKITPTVNEDGTFYAEATSLKGASLVFEGTLTDWGGNSTKEKYAFLVDSQTPRIEYISVQEPEGYYGIDQTLTIFIRFNKDLKFGENTSIKLNNKQIVTKPTKSGNDLLFKYTIGSDDAIDKLDVESATFAGVTDSGTDVTLDIKEYFDKYIFGSDKNLAEMKKIGIITSVPKVNTVEFDKTKNILTITYDKEVEKGSGYVTIEQTDVRVPIVLSEADGRTLFAKAKNKNVDLEQYYELTTNGADDKFKANLTSKYVLKYEYNSDGTKDGNNTSNLITDFQKTEEHIIKQNVLADVVTIQSDNKTVTVEFSSPLPCKGAKYKVIVPQGFMYDMKGSSNFPADGHTTDDFPADGVEEPVIRIKKNETRVENSSTKQPLTTEFKVDCRTPGAQMSYEYKCLTRNALAVRGRGTNKAPVYFNYYESKLASDSVDLYGNMTIITKGGNGKNSYNKFPYEGISTSDGGGKSGDIAIGTKIEIGDGDWQKGLEYNITATARNGDKDAKGYAVAYRTVVEINGLDISNVAPSDGNEKDLFIIGGDSPSGSNTVKGFPTTWVISDPEPTRLFTEINNIDDIVITAESYEPYHPLSNRRIYYFTSWGITKDYYFMFLRGNKGSNPNVPTGNATCAQNAYVSYFADYPINPGGYIKILNGYDDFNEPSDDDIWKRNTSKGDSAKFDAGKIKF